MNRTSKLGTDPGISMAAPPEGQKFDVAIVGAGILGVSIAYWVSGLYNISVCIIDRENGIARHTSSRNTGVIHRPFYLPPEKKRIFATAAQKSYSMWSSFAKKYSLPWSQIGTLELATRQEDLATLDQYGHWATANGMNESEYELLDSAGVCKLEPEVRGLGGILSRTDTSVNFGTFACQLYDLLERRGVRFFGELEVSDISEKPDGVDISVRNRKKSGNQSVRCGLLINAAGGGSLDIAHALDLARGYTDLHFRGEYRTVETSFGAKFS
ncbi:MAG: FAD-dependent oxidoreductase, partial [Nitrososphaerota archaeon]|nr:FAD-dependent oxidoreductase [Nitrososphaerota archaeon]